MRAFTSCQPTPTLKRVTSSHSLSAVFLLALILPGCASPGAPVARESQKPQSVTDLTATQVGNSIVLSFTLPKHTMRGSVITETPAVQIYRMFENVPANSGRAKPRLLVTIPSQMVTRYEQDGRVVFPEMLTPEDLTAHNGTEAVYEVRTRIGRSNSAPSNTFRIRILAALEPIQDLRARIVGSGIELAWSSPQTLTAGSEQPVVEYEVYREEVSGGVHKLQEQETARQRGGEGAEFKLLGQTSQPSYMDRSVESGRTYAYLVRSTGKYPSGSVESRDSDRVELAFAPILRPATPQHLVGTIISKNEPGVGFTVELSWAISPETNVAGYNVYRSENESGTGARVNSSPVLVPVFRDSSVAAGQKYFYHVTAVNRAGDESEPSAAVGVTVPESK